MIEVRNIKLKEQLGLQKVVADIIENNKKRELFFAVEAQFTDFLDSDSGDAFMLALLVPAMAAGKTLVIDAPVSKRLLWQLESFMIPALTQMNPKLQKIAIESRQGYSDQIYESDCVVTGLSCGVDSFYTVLELLYGERIPDTLTHFLLFHKVEGLENITETLQERATLQRQMVAKRFALPLIQVWSNAKTFMDFPYEQICVFHDLAIVLALKQKIHKYYYATGYGIPHFELDFSQTCHYDLLNANVIRTDSFEMISHNGMTDRIEKTRALADDPVAQKYLNVCSHPRESGTLNCSSCEKCKRTMVALDILGKLPLFSEVFDLDVYQKRRAQYVGWVLYKWYVNREIYAGEMVREMKRTGFPIPWSSYFFMCQTGVIHQSYKLNLL